MFEVLKKFKSFWLIELLLFAAGFYFVYDAFIADGSDYKVKSSTPASSSTTQSPAQPAPVVSGRADTVLETAVVCLDVDAKKKKPLVPKGRFSKYIDRLYCFTEISGKMPDVLIHDWVYKGQTYRQRIKVGNDTKVWSQMEMSPDKTGTWRVDIFTGDGTFLDSADFVLK
jgi:hypothetical protein